MYLPAFPSAGKLTSLCGMLITFFLWRREGGIIGLFIDFLFIIIFHISGIAYRALPTTNLRLYFLISVWFLRRVWNLCSKSKPYFKGSLLLVENTLMWLVMYDVRPVGPEGASSLPLRAGAWFCIKLSLDPLVQPASGSHSPSLDLLCGPH